MIHLTDATVDALYKGLLKAIQNLQYARESVCKNSSTNCINLNHQLEGANSVKRSEKNGVEVQTKKRVLCPYECNEILRDLYNWNDITERTERVYKRVLKEKDPPFGDKLNCYLSACIPFVLVVSFSYLLLKFLDIIEPRINIDLAVETYNSSHSQRNRKKNV